MSKGDSTLSGPANKPNKPHRGFPLFPHATRRWAKKSRGEMHYTIRRTPRPAHRPKG
jgi:hypothetical protein